MKCPICGREVENIEELEIYLNGDFMCKISACSVCANTIKTTASDEKFGEHLVEYMKDLSENWEKGTKENAKVGSVIKIMEMKDEPTVDYIGKSGVITHIDDAGQLHGTWGGLAVIPESDTFLVMKETATSQKEE